VGFFFYPDYNEGITPVLIIVLPFNCKEYSKGITPYSPMIIPFYCKEYYEGITPQYNRTK
jgi:hypothetical protein